MSTMRLTASERESLMRLNVAYEILSREGQYLNQRMGLIRYGRRDLGLLKAVIQRLMAGVIDTIPEKQMQTYIHSLEMVSYTVGARMPGEQNTQNTRDYGMWLPYEVINALLEGLHDHCMMCPADPAQRRACKLRKALTTIPNDAQEREGGDCPYYTVM